MALGLRLTLNLLSAVLGAAAPAVTQGVLLSGGSDFLRISGGSDILLQSGAA